MNIKVFARFSFSLAVLVVLAGTAKAQCPGVPVISGTEAYVSSSPVGDPDPDEISALIGGGCTTGMFGPNPPDNCSHNVTPMLAILVAVWGDSAHNVSANGCTFNCGGGSCRIRGGDGLPVELLDFGISNDG